LLQALEARVRERTNGLQKFLAERAEKEMNDITTILSELRSTILAELRQPEVVQLQLAGFSTAEQEQFERNMSALAERAEQIDAEIEQERANIRRRFADPQPRLFPVAVNLSCAGTHGALERVRFIMSIARQHAEWLSLIEVSGPFLSMPVLLSVFPQGLEKDEREAEQRRTLRMAY